MHAARAAAKQLFSHFWWPRTRRALVRAIACAQRERESNVPSGHAQLTGGAGCCLVVKPVRRACARGWIFGQNASLTHVASRQGARSASEMQSCWLDNCLGTHTLLLRRKRKEEPRSPVNRAGMARGSFLRFNSIVKQQPEILKQIKMKTD